MNFYELLFYKYIRDVESTPKINMLYSVFKNGIEQLLPTNTSTPTTTPILADIKYPDEERDNQYFTYRESPTTVDGRAKIKTIKGNTLVFNQLVQNGNFADTSIWTATSNISFSVENNIVTVSASADGNNYIKSNYNGVMGHKILFICDYYAEVTQDGLINVYYGDGNTRKTLLSPTIGEWDTYSFIETCVTGQGAQQFEIRLQSRKASGVTKFKNCMIIDLTLMFGPGNEPTSVSDFTNLFTLPYYDYNVGSLLSFNGTGIKTTGKNQLNPSVFNEALAYTVNDDGSLTVNASDPRAWTTITTFHLKKGNYILTRSVPNGVCDIRFAYENFATNHLIANQLASYPFAVLQDTDVKIKVGYSYSAYPFTTNVMIRIADADDTFEPYTENTIDLPISTYFPTGMKSAGTVYDELTKSKVITRIGAVDLGTLNWTYANSRFQSTDLNNLIATYSTSDYPNIKCPKYPTFTANQTVDMTFGITAFESGGTMYLRVLDSNYTSASDFKTAINGVYLYYELETPTETEVVTP